MLKKYQISEVPHLMIIDKKGLVAFSGHPAELDLASTLLALIEDRPVNFTLSTSLDGEPDLSGFRPISDEDLAALPAKQSSYAYTLLSHLLDVKQGKIILLSQVKYLPQGLMHEATQINLLADPNLRPVVESISDPANYT